jgi:hypothetical protein
MLPRRALLTVAVAAAALAAVQSLLQQGEPLCQRGAAAVVVLPVCLPLGSNLLGLFKGKLDGGTTRPVSCGNPFPRSP